MRAQRTVSDRTVGGVAVGVLCGLQILLIGCTTTVYTVGPRCPEWSDEAVEDLGRVIDLEQYPALEEAIGRQELYCAAMEPADTSEQCFGFWCWWRELWR